MEIHLFLWLFDKFCRHLIYFIADWHILRSFDIFSSFWYIESRRIWQLGSSHRQNDAAKISYIFGILCITNVVIWFFSILVNWTIWKSGNPDLYTNWMTQRFRIRCIVRSFDFFLQFGISNLEESGNPDLHTDMATQRFGILCGHLIFSPIW
jgi:hypothetical protein